MSPAPRTKAPVVTADDGPVRDGMGATVTGYLLAGPLVYGGLGLFADHFLNTRLWTPIGILAGMALAMYVVWLRYGKSGDGPTSPETASSAVRPTSGSDLSTPTTKENP